MALADLDALIALVRTPDNITFEMKSLTTSVGRQQRWCSVWARTFDHQGTAPSTAAAVSNATAGAWTKVNAGSGRQIVVGGTNRVPVATISNPGITGTGYAPRPVLLIDRLSHQGGLDGNTNTVQTTNLPTAALTRYTNGVGVMAAFENYSTIGSTASQLSMSYTNSAGTASQVGALPPFILSEMLNTFSTFIPFNLAAGDLGVKSVESVQFSVATGTVGNFGITLFKPVGLIWVNADGTFTVMHNAMWNEEILDDACLQMLDFGTNGTIGTSMRSLSLAEC